MNIGATLLTTATLTADLYGEEINRDKHKLLANVKAMTRHRFQVRQTTQGWEATVILDT